MRSRSLFISIIFSLTISLYAQPGKESWHWAFGSAVGLDFSSGSPVAVIDSINTQEGSASISDSNTGQLLFYTDGTHIWDKNNHRMPNGYGLIGGEGTATQAALIIQKPGTNNLYYVFTADQGGYCCGTTPQANTGIHYSIVDMTLNGGLGDVTVKNVLLTPPPTTEKLTAVKHCNDRDYWVITHPFNSNAFNAYLVNPAGISPTPVVSNVGGVQNNAGGNFYETTGYLKASPNCKRLASAVPYLNLLEVFDFDNSNGTVSAPISLTVVHPTISGNPDTVGAYGLSFSPDNSKLYASIGTYNGDILQYDLNAGTSAAINATRKSILPGLEGCALQLASNNKIYICDYIHLGSINNPNDTGISCNYHSNVITFSYGSSTYGLPNFIDANRAAPFHNNKETQLCNFSTYTLTASGNNNYQWSTSDTTQAIVISNFGDYTVSYLNSDGCKEIDTFWVTQIQPPSINQLRDTSACSNVPVSVTINATYPSTVSYNWNDGFNQPVHTITTVGTKWVDYTLNNFCVSRDSFNFFIDSIPSVNLGRDTALCKPLTLSANAGEQYSWSNGSTTQQINVTTSGTYSITVTSPQGCKNSDTVNVTIYIPPIINILSDSRECGNFFFSVNVNAVYPNTTLYNWSDGFMGQTHSLTTPGIYWVDFTLNNTCVSRDSFNLYLYPYPVVSLGSDTTFCLGRLPLNVVNSSCTYIWSTGETTSNIIATHAGTYWVQVNRHGCISSDTLVVNPAYSAFNFTLPNIVTPNNDNINDFIDFSNYQFSSLQLDIYNRWGNKIFESSDPAIVWRPTCDDGSYYYVAQYKIECGTETQSKSLKGFVTVLR